MRTIRQTIRTIRESREGIAAWRRAQAARRASRGARREHAVSPTVAADGSAAAPGRAGADSPRVLIVEDSPRIAAMLVEAFREGGYEVRVVSDVHRARHEATAGHWNLILLDVLLPDGNGIELCTTLRREGVNTPVFVLTALDSTSEKVQAFDAGADDYLTKPFDIEEVLARSRALLRRASSQAPATLRCADLELDPIRRCARRGNDDIALTGREFALLQCLMAHRGQTLTRADIARLVWGGEKPPASNIVDVYISALRRKIDRGCDMPLIRTIVGQGYTLAAP